MEGSPIFTTRIKSVVVVSLVSMNCSARRFQRRRECLSRGQTNRRMAYTIGSPTMGGTHQGIHWARKHAS